MSEPAYPMPDAVYPNGQVQPGWTGLTKRELFAAMAMQSPVLNETLDAVSLGAAAEELGIPMKDYRCQEHYPLLVARRAVQMADALLAELSRLPASADEEQI